MHSKVYLRLKNKLVKDKTSIRLVIYSKHFTPHGYFVYGTGELIEPRFFDEQTERPTKDKRLLKELNKEEQRSLRLLDERLAYIQSVARQCTDSLLMSKRRLEANKLRVLLDKELGVNVPMVNSNVLEEYLDKYITEAINGKRTTSEGKRYSEGAIKNYKTFKSQFLLFQSFAKKKFTLEEIDQGFYNGFVSFLNSKNYSPNTIGKHIARLKKLLRSAKEDNLYHGNEHERQYFKTLEVDTEHIYLTQTELDAIRGLDLSNHKDLILYRDVFLIGCLTAQRVSDYKDIRPEHKSKTSKGINILKLKQKKTGEEVIIPIGTELDSLLSKYSYHIPLVHEQKLNEAIKEIGRLAGIDDEIEVEMVRGGIKKRIVCRKCELIKSHTARRTGATNMYLANIPTIDIMKITGHKKESNFLKYIKIGKEETADKLASHSYFK